MHVIKTKQNKKHDEGPQFLKTCKWELEKGIQHSEGWDCVQLVITLPCVLLQVQVCLCLNGTSWAAPW